MNELQQGLAKKFAELVQAVLSNGGWFCRRVLLFVKLSLVIVATAPLIFIATMMLVKTVATLEKTGEAYKAADAVAGVT